MAENSVSNETPTTSFPPSILLHLFQRKPHLIPKLINVNHKNVVANFGGNFDKITISDEIYLIGRMRLRGRLDRIHNSTPFYSNSKLIIVGLVSFVQFCLVANWKHKMCNKVFSNISSKKRQPIFLLIFCGLVRENNYVV